MTFAYNLAICFFFIGLAIAASCDALSDPEIVYRAVLCPPDWRATVSQRYDDRDRYGRIVRSTWLTRCI